jgi:arsenite transporter
MVAGALLAMVVCLIVFLIAGAPVGTVLDAGPVLLTVLPVFVGFLLVAALRALGLTRWLQLPMDAERTLAVSFGTRSSFVVLPFALAFASRLGDDGRCGRLPAAGWNCSGWCLCYLWWLPRHLFQPEKSPIRLLTHDVRPLCLPSLPVCRLHPFHARRDV